MRRFLLSVPSAIALLAPTLVTAWTPYGYGPPAPPTGPSQATANAAQPAPGLYGGQSSGGYPMPPGYGRSGPMDASGYPFGSGPLPPWAGADYGGPTAYGQPPAYGDYGPPGYGFDGPPGGEGYGYGPPPSAADEDAEGVAPSGPRMGRATPGGYPDRPTRGGGMRISQTLTDDGYLLEIHLGGQRAESIQLEPQGQSLVIRRDRSAQTEERETFDEGQGFSRRYSYSTGRTFRRLRVPPDADLAALSREDGDESIRVLIPRQQQP